MDPTQMDQVIELDDAQLERTWQLAKCLVQSGASTPASLDLLFVTAARFVKKVDDGLDAGGVVLETGDGRPGTQTVTIRRTPEGSR